MKVLLIVALVLLPSLAFAQETKTMTATYTEPTQSANGQPLTDLKETVVQVFRADGTSWIEPVTVPASSPTGGITQSVKVDLLVTADTEEEATFVVKAVDLAGNTSVPVTKTSRIDNLLPSGVEGLEITVTVTFRATVPSTQ